MKHNHLYGFHVIPIPPTPTISDELRPTDWRRGISILRNLKELRVQQKCSCLGFCNLSMFFTKAKPKSTVVTTVTGTSAAANFQHAVGLMTRLRYTVSQHVTNSTSIICFFSISSPAWSFKSISFAESRSLFTRV